MPSLAARRIRKSTLEIRSVGLWIPLSTVLVLIAVVGCARAPVDRPILARPTVNLNLDLAKQDNTRGEMWQLENATDRANVSLNKARVFVTRFENHTAAPTTQTYFGDSCDKFYMNGTGGNLEEPFLKCRVPYVDVGYASRFRTDPNNFNRIYPYHVVLIDQSVKVDRSGYVLGATTPRADNGDSTQRCSFIFDQQIRAWLDDVWSAGDCGYETGGRQDYVTKMIYWTVGHELGRQVGELHTSADFGHETGEHDLNQQVFDYMRPELTRCEPIMRKYEGDYYCYDTDTVSTNSCIDRLRNHFHVPR